MHAPVLTNLVRLTGHRDRNKLLHIVLLEGRHETVLQCFIVRDYRAYICI